MQFGGSPVDGWEMMLHLKWSKMASKYLSTVVTTMHQRVKLSPKVHIHAWQWKILFPICKLHYAYLIIRCNFKCTCSSAHLIHYVSSRRQVHLRVQMFQSSAPSITKISESFSFISINVCRQSMFPKLQIALYVGISALKSYFRQTHALSQDSLDSSCKEKITNELQPHEGPDCAAQLLKMQVKQHVCKAEVSHT